MVDKGRVLLGRGIVEESTKDFSRAAAVDGAGKVFGTKDLQVPGSQLDHKVANCGIPRELVSASLFPR